VIEGLPSFGLLWRGLRCFGTKRRGEDGSGSVSKHISSALTTGNSETLLPTGKLPPFSICAALKLTVRSENAIFIRVVVQFEIE
jgi:hypothetical protein